MIKKNSRSINAFSRSVESLVLKNYGKINYIDAVCIKAEELEIEIENAVKLLNDHIREKINIDAKRLHLVTKDA